MSNGSSGSDTEKPNKQPIADRIAEVLIDTEFYPLVLIGKGIKRFGPWIVVAFLLGVAFTFLYSRIESAPLHDILFPSKHAVGEETISVLGEIQDWEDKPIQSARAFIVPEKYIVEANDDGQIKANLPKGKYKVVIFESQNPLNHAIEYFTEEKQNFHVKMPQGIGVIRGTVIDLEHKGKEGIFVCASGGLLKWDACTTTDSDGDYILESIPEFIPGTDHLTVRVVKTRETKIIPKIESHKPTLVDPFVVSKEDPIIQGFVRDRYNRPVPNMWVSIDGRHNTITAADGFYSVSVPTMGQYTLEVRWGKKVLYSTPIAINTDLFEYNIPLN